jgi:hypothetical protein
MGAYLRNQKKIEKSADVIFHVGYIIMGAPRATNCYHWHIPRSHVVISRMKFHINPSRGF